MSAAPVSLDQGPPQPQALQPQGASAQQMAGQPGSQPTASLQQALVQSAMGVEKALNDMTQLAPDLAAPFSSLIDQFRKIVGGVIAKGAAPPQASAFGTGQTTMPGGAPTS
jgi:hypothetical protein